MSVLCARVDVGLNPDLRTHFAIQNDNSIWGVELLDSTFVSGYSRQIEYFRSAPWQSLSGIQIPTATAAGDLHYLRRGSTNVVLKSGVRLHPLR